MRRLISGAVIAVAVLTALPVAAQSEPALSYEWAEKASAEDAGQRLLGPLAALYPNYGGHSYSPFGVQWGVAFASTARSSGREGMCEADVVNLQFVYQRRDPEAEQPSVDDDSADFDADFEPAPSVLRKIHTETRFRAIADTAPQPWTEEYEVDLDAACARQTDGWDFTIAEDATDAWYGARLQTTLPDMAINQPEAFLGLLAACSGTEECRTPFTLVVQLRQARFWYGDVRPCDALVDVYQPPRFEGPFCLKARYLMSSHAGESEYLYVTARFNETVNGNQELTDPHLRAVTLQRESIIED